MVSGFLTGTPLGLADAPAAGGGAGGFMSLLPLAAIFLVFYFLLIRPQQKKQKELQEWIKGLKKGDEVVTSGGVIGRITGLSDHTVTLEVQEKVRLKVLKSHVSGRPPAAGVASAPVAEAPPVK